ncbi:hypothetical protein KAT51_04315 [bacterium]|nr:hypothetical protein [bacterium]
MMRDLKRKIQEIVEAQTNSLWTAAIGVVTKAGTRVVDVQIKNKIVVDGSEEAFPIIRDVPVLFPHTSNLSVVSPLIVNDTVLIVFTKYNSKGLLDSSNTLLSRDSRQFSLNDAVAIPGFFLSPDALPEVSEGEGIVYHKSGCFVKFDSDGKINIKSAVEVNIQEGTKGAARKDDTVSAKGRGNLGFPVSVTGNITSGSSKTKIG